MPSGRTAAEKGERQVCLLNNSNEQNPFRVICCTADGHKLPPFIVFEHKIMPTKETLLPKVIVWVNEKGFFTNETVLRWFHPMRCRCPASLLEPQSMFVLRSFHDHMAEWVKKTVANDLVITSGKMTSMLHS